MLALLACRVNGFSTGVGGQVSRREFAVVHSAGAGSMTADRRTVAGGLASTVLIGLSRFGAAANAAEFTKPISEGPSPQFLENAKRAAAFKQNQVLKSVL